MIHRILSVIMFVTLLILLSCNGDKPDTEAIEYILPDSGISIEGAWARPGRANGVTAVYLHVLNGSAKTDTLISLSSPAAGLTELHETFERGEGMMGMREAEEPWFPGRSIVAMQPGGLHIMLMQLRTELLEGDQVEVNLNFAIAGEVTVTAPVREPGSR